MAEKVLPAPISERGLKRGCVIVCRNSSGYQKKGWEL
jgi:hypothetical protein